MRWTILAPWQAAGAVSVEHPHRIDLGERSIGVLFYDAPLSATVSFDPAATSDADRFARQAIRPRLERAATHVPGSGRGGATGAAPGGIERRATPRHADSHVVLVATDGELYGHHQQFRDLFLDRLLSHRDGFTITTAGAVMDGLDAAALDVVGIVDPSSWSCHHGVARWYGECPDVADGHWKRPLRQAFDRLAAALDAAVERWFSERGLDLWELRDAYADVASGYAAPEAWLDEQMTRGRGVDGGSGGKAPSLHEEEQRRALALLRAEAARLQMFASDGWFWGDPRRLETAQVLRFAAFAARTVDAELGTTLEGPFVADLAAIRAPDVPDNAIPQLVNLRTGDEIYAATLESVSQPPTL